MTDRFDNIATADLVAREAEYRAEAYQLKVALRARLIAEAAPRFIVGAVYRIAADGRSLGGRLLKLEGINAEVDSFLPDLRGTRPWRVYAWGRLNGKSVAGDGWTIKRQNVNVERLEPYEADP